MNPLAPAGTALLTATGFRRVALKSRRVILRDVSLQIGAGERLGLVGPTGSGKSTLLRMLALLDAHGEGDVRFRGRPIDPSAVPGFRRQVIYLAQRPAITGPRVRDALSLPFQWAATGAHFDQSRGEALLERLGRPPSFLDQESVSLSGGERQLVALVRALLLEPLVLLLDEPTAALDAEAAERCEGVIAEWHRRGCDRAYVWTSHHGEQVRRMTDRQLTIRDGRLITPQDPEA